MSESHHLLESWLIEGAVGDPPRELALHAAVCDSCARRLGAFDSLALVDVGAAGSPPPVAAPTTVVVGLAWARVGTAVLGTVVAGVIVAFAASQLVGFVGNLPAPTEGVALETASGAFSEPRSIAPEPADEPSVPEPTPVPEATFIPLPTPVPGATIVPAPASPNLSLRSVGTASGTIGWTQPGGGGPPFKYELWRATGSGGPWVKIAELPGFRRDVTNTGLQPGQLYRFRIRAVSASGLGTYSNTVSATTKLSPTPPPSAGPTPSPSPSPSIPPTTECNDGINNDFDGLVDTSDPGCSSPTDSSELDASVECDNGGNDDSDGLIDSNDPGCAGPTDSSELDAAVACDNGVTDDFDNLADMNDPGCSGPTDSSELSGAQCDNGTDDDGDSMVDMLDLECTDPTDIDEAV